MCRRSPHCPPPPRPTATLSKREGAIAAEWCGDSRSLGRDLSQGSPAIGAAPLQRLRDGPRTAIDPDVHATLQMHQMNYVIEQKLTFIWLAHGQQNVALLRNHVSDVADSSRLHHRHRRHQLHEFLLTSIRGFPVRAHRGGPSEAREGPIRKAPEARCEPGKSLRAFAAVRAHAPLLHVGGHAPR